MKKAETIKPIKTNDQILKFDKNEMLSLNAMNSIFGGNEDGEGDGGGNIIIIPKK